MNTPLVSVIMPAYNASNFIQEAIDSVIAQTFSNWELIIIDDGSTDKTAEIIADNVNSDHRIKSFYQQNGKQGKARNLAISHTRGLYIAFLDADDLWLPEKLSIQLEEITTKNVDLVFSDSYVFYDNNSSDRSTIMKTTIGTLTGNGALTMFLELNRIPNLTVLAKKSKILFVNNFSENSRIANAEDYHLWLKMLIKGCAFYGSEKVLTAYRMHRNASTNNDKLASKKLPTVFYDLMQKYPEAKPMLLKALKCKFKIMYTKGVYSKYDLNNGIEDNCVYLGKQSYIPFFKGLHYFFGTRITRRILKIFLNG